MFLDDLKNPANIQENDFETIDEWIIPGPISNGKCSVSGKKKSCLKKIGPVHTIIFNFTKKITFLRKIIFFS